MTTLSIDAPFRPFSSSHRCGPLTRLFSKLSEEFLGLSHLDRLYRHVPRFDTEQDFLQHVMRLFNVSLQVNERETQNIPRQGGAIVVANHPFGGFEGVAMAHQLLTIRTDVKVLTTEFLRRVPELQSLFIGVDNLSGSSARRRNGVALREAYRWVKDGGLLVIFPAGEVSHWRPSERAIIDPQWDSVAARIARKTDSPVIPAFFHGYNRMRFQIAGLLHPRLRTLMLAREFIAMRDRTLELNIGKAIPPARFHRLSDEEATVLFRLKCYGLQHVPNPNETLDRAFGLPIASPSSKVVLAAEVASLSRDALLVDGDALQVYCARAADIPNVLQEIGRLREITFRATGEGTGRSRDVDLFDDYYQHLFIWNRQSNEIVGAYRLGLVDEIIQRFGVRGLYTHSLFRYRQRLVDAMSPAIELGRSFVREEYQRSYQPLLLLWKGIGQFVARNPRYRTLFGPVSISSDYETVSRQLLVAFLQSNRYLPELARHVKPRNAFSPRGLGETLSSLALDEPDRLSELLSRIEEDSKGMPILIKQYLKMGGRFIGFNLDQDFNDAVDGLIVVDLAETEVKVLGRYMGRESAEAFLDYHETLDEIAS